MTPMKLGAVLPQQEMGTDPSVIREYAKRVEALGFSQLAAYDHVVGAGLENRPNWSGYYSAEDAFHEPFVLFAHLAAVTTTLEFMTCVIVLPQRQTALVAKQAAELHILSGGRFHLGVGTGWNEVEYEALGVPFERRAARLEEQVGVLRALWADPNVRFEGEYHRITDAGLNPLPGAQVPIWLGGGQSEASADRIARLADGWMAPHIGPDEATPILADLHRRLDALGRSHEGFGVHARLFLAEAPRGEWRDIARAWADLGVTHLDLATGNMGLESVGRHVELLADALGVLA